MRQATSYGRQGTRRRTSSRRYRSNPYESTGNGWIIVGFIGLILIGTYFLMDENQRGDLMTFMEQIKKESVALLPTTAKTPAPIVTTPCTQGNIAKILVYTLKDATMLEEGKPGEAWYHKYYNLLKTDPKFNFLDEQYAMHPLSHQEAESILKGVFGEQYKMTGEVSLGQKEQYMTLADFLKVYEQALKENEQTHGLSYQELSILATPANHTGLQAWQTITNQGTFGFEGLILDPYKDHTLKVITKGSEILGVVELVSDQSKVENCVVVSVEENRAVIQVGGQELEYGNDALTKADEGQVGEITIYNSKIIDYNLQMDTDVDQIVRVTDEAIEFAKAGVIPCDEILVYTGDEVGNYTNKSQLFSGMQVTYTLKGDRVNTVKVVNDQVDDTVRVALTSDGLGDYTHDTVIITSQEDCMVTYGERKLKLEAGTVWDVSSFDWNQKNEKLIIEPMKQGMIEIQSMVRQKIAPIYSGNLEIYKEDKGYTVVNVLDIENYVAHVIPSEMPTSYGLEAAKVQAVAARSYAKAHQKSSKFAKYGAQLDDTTSSQVYNNVATNDVAKQAVNETKGEVMTYNERVISGNFFAASCGYTANYGETWAAEEIFPTNTPVYLVSRQQYVDERLADNLSEEKDAYAFFTKSPDQIDAFDNHSPWFRWQVQLNGKELEEIINSNIYRLTTQYANMVKVLDEKENKWTTREMNTLGKIKDLEVRKRGNGGNIMELVVIGEEGVVKVSTEYLIRCLLAPVQKDGSQEPIQVKRADGTTVDNMAMLPSAFFSMDIQYSDNLINGVTIYGGGFGHGVGMSQDGVKGMVERGFDYKAILEHYYSNIVIQNL